ncbi:MAG: hypothetical protein ACYC6N_16285 [Pirellulaceae bacterium]
MHIPSHAVQRVSSIVLGAMILASAGSQAAEVDKDAFEIHVLCDFMDDLQWGGVFDQDQLRHFLETYKEWGVTRIYWMSDTVENGTFDLDTPTNRKAFETFENTGEFIPAAVKIAHELGMEFYVQFKPFDQVIPCVYAHGNELHWLRNPQRKGIPVRGGCWPWATTWVENHPQFLMARNMTGVREGIDREPIGTLKIVKNNAEPTAITRDNLELYVSTDNVTYRKYDAPYTFCDTVEERPVMIKGVNLNERSTQTETVRVLTLGGLQIQEPYLAISTQTKSGAPDFANVFYRLIEMYTVQGEAMPFTYGPCTETTDYNSWLCHAGLENATFPNYGFGFEISGYLGTAWRPQDLLDEEIYLDGHRKILGLAKGKNPYISALCPAHREVKQYWLDQVQKFIDWGADGVDFRWPGHQDTMDWVAYGFNQPVVEEFKNRYGVDIRTQEFDRDKWRKLLGEHYTDFYRQAKALLAQHGRKMQVDVLAVDDPARSPPLQHYCNIFHDWPTWFSFADSVTLRRYHRDFDTKPFRSVAVQYGLPTYYSVWSWMIWEDLTPEQISGKIREIWLEGNQGLVLYETAALYRIKPDGSFYQPRPELVQGMLNFKATRGGDE